MQPNCHMVTKENKTTTTPGQRPSTRPIEVTPTDDDRNQAHHTDEVTDDTPPPIKEAITTIESFEFDPYKDERNQSQLNAALMMLGSNNTTSVVAPTLRTEPWPHKGEKPNPINLNTARRLLAAGYASIPCEIDGADIHGYAWMVETPTEWKARGGVKEDIAPPTKPTRGDPRDLTAQYVYMLQMKEYKEYTNLMHDGRKKLIEWFGKDMFLDLYVNKQLPVHITPRELLDYLAKTYANPRTNRQYMESIRKSFNTAYDNKKPVETFFARLQEVRDSAKILGEPFSDQQLVNKAISQFERVIGRDTVRKMETRWYETPEAEQDWQTFKVFWKEEIHLWEGVDGKAARSANQATMEDISQKMASMEATISALQSDNRSYQQQNNALVAEQIEIGRALQQQKNNSSSSSDDDDMSALTGFLSTFEKRIVDGFNTQIRDLKASIPAAANRPSKAELLRAANERRPDSYKHLNDGRGKQFTRYCWHCGCNCTHSTRRCLALSDELCEKYKDASFKDTMGGNTKFIERRNDYQKKHQFDSL